MKSIQTLPQALVIIASLVACSVALWPVNLRTVSAQERASTAEAFVAPEIDPTTRGKPANYIEQPVPRLGTRTDGVDWPAFMGPTQNNTSPEKGIITDWPEQGPRIVWTKPLGNSYTLPVTSQGRLFQFHAFENTARLSCWECETGNELWKFEYEIDYKDIYGFHNGARNSPVVDGDRVYIFGVEGMLHCLRIADGSLVWKLDTTAAYGVVQNFFGVGCNPVVEDDLLIVPIGGSPPGSPAMASGRLKGNGSGIVAFNKYSGQVVYQITDELASYSSPVLATIDNRRWCFMFARGGLVGFEPATGKVDFLFPWRAKATQSVNASCPVVAGDLVFISEGYDAKHGAAVLRVRPGNCEVVWSDAGRRDKAMQIHFMTPVHVDGFLYGCRSSAMQSGADLRCIELATGQLRWSEADLPRSSLLSVDGHFVCLTEDGVLRLLKATPEKFDVRAEVTLKTRVNEGGEQLLKSPAWAPPVLSHGLLYVRGIDRLVCLELIPAK